MPSSTTDIATHRLVTFTVGGRTSAIDAGFVREIVRMVALTESPGAPPWIAGIVNVRGTAAPVVDLRVRLGVPAAPYTLATPIIIVDTAFGLGGIIVDAVVDVVDVPDGVRARDAGAGSGWGTVAPVRGQFVPVIDVNAVCGASPMADVAVAE